jgi:hypothetical protein
MLLLRLYGQLRYWEILTSAIEISRDNPKIKGQPITHWAVLLFEFRQLTTYIRGSES